jgi:hypothetical protein
LNVIANAEIPVKKQGPERIKLLALLRIKNWHDFFLGGRNRVAIKMLDKAHLAPGIINRATPNLSLKLHPKKCLLFVKQDSDGRMVAWIPTLTKPR